jgi:hypothetical protein
VGEQLLRRLALLGPHCARFLHLLLDIDLGADRLVALSQLVRVRGWG